MFLQQLLKEILVFSFIFVYRKLINILDEVPHQKQATLIAV